MRPRDGDGRLAADAEGLLDEPSARYGTAGYSVTEPGESIWRWMSKLRPNATPVNVSRESPPTLAMRHSSTEDSLIPVPATPPNSAIWCAYAPAPA